MPESGGAPQTGTPLVARGDWGAIIADGLLAFAQLAADPPVVVPTQPPTPKPTAPKPAVKAPAEAGEPTIMLPLTERRLKVKARQRINSRICRLALLPLPASRDPDALPPPSPASTLGDDDTAVARARKLKHHHR